MRSHPPFLGLQFGLFRLLAAAMPAAAMLAGAPFRAAAQDAPPSPVASAPSALPAAPPPTPRPKLDEEFRRRAYAVLQERAGLAPEPFPRVVEPSGALRPIRLDVLAFDHLVADLVRYYAEAGVATEEQVLATMRGQVETTKTEMGGRVHAFGYRDQDPDGVPRFVFAPVNDGRVEPAKGGETTAVEFFSNEGELLCIGFSSDEGTGFQSQARGFQGSNVPVEDLAVLRQAGKGGRSILYIGSIGQTYLLKERAESFVEEFASEANPETRVERLAGYLEGGRTARAMAEIESEPLRAFLANWKSWEIRSVNPNGDVTFLFVPRDAPPGDSLREWRTSWRPGRDALWRMKLESLQGHRRPFHTGNMLAPEPTATPTPNTAAGAAPAGPAPNPASP